MGTGDHGLGNGDLKFWRPAVVTANWVVDAGLTVNRFKAVRESGNTVISPGAKRPDRPAGGEFGAFVVLPGDEPSV